MHGQISEAVKLNDRHRGQIYAEVPEPFGHVELPGVRSEADLPREAAEAV